MNNKYLSYNPIELAADDQFIDWVRSGQPQNHPWSNWIANHPEKQNDLNEAIELVHALQFKASENLGSMSNDIWHRINTTIDQEEKEEVKVVTLPRRNVLRIVGYVAAACIAGLFVFQFLFNNNERVYADYGMSLAHTLPDNSEIKLNADSRITYNKKQWSNERRLKMDGEAYFDVEEGQKFTVETDYGTVAVLGTSFNIYSRPDGFSVHCTSGKVEVSNQNATVILTPDVKTRLDSQGEFVTETLSKGSNVDWLDKIYRFDSVPLKVVFQAIERQFDVRIDAEANIESRLYTGSFTATDLDNALRVVAFPMELITEKKGNKIIVQSNVDN